MTKPVGDSFGADENPTKITLALKPMKRETVINLEAREARSGPPAVTKNKEPGSKFTVVIFEISLGAPSAAPLLTFTVPDGNTPIQELPPLKLIVPLKPPPLSKIK